MAKSDDKKVALTTGFPGRVPVDVSSVAIFTLIRHLEVQGRDPEFTRGAKFVRRYKDRYKGGLTHEGVHKMINRLIDAHNQLSGRND